MNKNELLKKLANDGFSKKILQVFEKIPRENFIPQQYRNYSYEDIPLPIGYGQTISQPYTIAFMLSLLEVQNKQKILEIGSGSGYVLALLSELSKNGEIFGVERINEIAEHSKEILKNYKNVKVFISQQEIGLKEFAPYDRILVSASTKKIPKNLLKQLKINGVMVIPVRDSIFQIKRNPNGFVKKEFYGFAFVPLVKD